MKTVIIYLITSTILNPILLASWADIPLEKIIENEPLNHTWENYKN